MAVAGAGSAVAVALVLYVAWPWLGLQEGRDSPPPTADAAYVGVRASAGCQYPEHERWRRSHHDLAMQPASADTVRGDFGGVRFAEPGGTFTFSRDGNRFGVRAEGPDGRVRDYDIKYTFGVTPLQQYLVELDGGRLQALTIAWDTRPREAGGQRWFSLYPGERLRPGDPLHWTGYEQTWNYQCAECHSTGVRKNYDATFGRYATGWAEVNVACEACHGPGSRHVAWAERRASWWTGEGDPRKGLMVVLHDRGQWRLDPATGNARRSAPRAADGEIEVCAVCHSRRSVIAEGAPSRRRLMETHLPALLDPELYHADGQQQGEVYTYASFLQSRMYREGVTCSDCHEPHSLGLRAPGNGVCAQCHAPARYDTASHHFHRPGSTGAACVGCHMPAATYMLVDPRRDHSLRVPRPDLSVELGMPNACTACHTDRDPAWARNAVRAWYGRDPGGHQRYARALHAGRAGQPGALALLAELIRDAGQPAVARATALTLISRSPGPTALEAVRQGLRDPDPLLRRAALAALEAAPPEQRPALAAPLLGDPVRAVRIEAGRVLASVSDAALGSAERAARHLAIEEYIASQRLNADRPEARVNLGLLHAQRAQAPEAELEYRAAISLWRGHVPAYVNLADLYRLRGREDDAERVLRDGLAVAPGDPSLHHALGLALARQKRLDAAVGALRRAATLAPSVARYRYVYAVALHDAGRRDEAIRVLEDAVQRHPFDPDLLFGLAAFHRERGELARALGYAERLAAVMPEDPRARDLLAALRRPRW
jgi:Flp pilus assembly protein TadD